MNTTKIVQAIEKSELSVNKLSDLSDVGYATLYDIAKRKTKNPRIDTVIKIATALKIPINELLSEERENEKSDT